MTFKRIPFLLFFCLSMNIYAGISGGLPKPIQAVLLSKTLQFYTNSSPQLTIYVVGDDGIVAELKKIAGKGKILKVEAGAGLPSSKPDVVFLVDSSKVNDVIGYTRTNRILSCTSDPELVKKGISLGLVQMDGKPKINLNSTGYEKESIRWNPSLLKPELSMITK
ncbi:MAG: DUF4154 domain-containing protein [Oligoflexia bacterium]|nr:DUF4154 domain-containing protein [Oligoflexia bacterium]